jgi:hypothetical protein
VLRVKVGVNHQNKKFPGINFCQNSMSVPNLRLTTVLVVTYCYKLSTQRVEGKKRREHRDIEINSVHFQCLSLIGL